MYDRDTGSLWSQVIGRAVAGPLAGQLLEELPSQLTNWGDWKTRHPETLALRVVGGRPRGAAYAEYHRDGTRIGIHGTRSPDERLPVKALVFGVRVGDAEAAVSLLKVKQDGLVQGAVDGWPIAVFSVGAQGETALSYSRMLEGRSLSFESVDGLRVRDRETGSLWWRESGECLEGELAGKTLTPVSGKMVYWGVWAQMHPSSELVF